MTATTTQPKAGAFDRKTGRAAANPERRTGVLPTSGHVAVRPPTAAHLSDEDVERLGAELDATRDEVLAQRGAKDAAYIKKMVKIQRVTELAGRVAMIGARSRIAWSAGVGLIALGMAFTEGSANDWVSVAVIDDYGAPAAIGTPSAL